MRSQDGEGALGTMTSEASHKWGPGVWPGRSQWTLDYLKEVVYPAPGGCTHMCLPLRFIDEEPGAQRGSEMRIGSHS